MPRDTKHVIDTGLDFGADYTAAYGASGPTQLFVNSNLSPHFPYAAQIWASMWQRQTGEHIDGAIALDPQVLANFLAATGPVTTKEQITVGATNVVALTEQQEYTLFADNTARKQFLVNVLRAAAGKVLDGSADPGNLLRAMSLSAREHRVLVWSEDPGTQAVIDQTDYCGSPSRTTSAFSSVSWSTTRQAGSSITTCAGRSATSGSDVDLRAMSSSRSR